MQKAFLTAGWCFVFFVLLVHLLFAWMNTNVDSYFYHLYARYIQTGVYPAPFDYTYKTPLGGSSPLYSLLLAFLYNFPRADIVLHIIQLLSYGLTIYLLYKILCMRLPRNSAGILTIFFALLPGNLIHISYVMNDIMTQTLLMMYIYYCARFVQTKKTTYLSLGAFFAAVVGLWRFSFIFLVPLTIFWLIWTARKRLTYYMLPSLGILLIFIWIIINHHITGIWGLTYASFRFQMQMAWQAKRMPPENDPTMIELRKFIPRSVDLYRPYWEFETYFRQGNVVDNALLNKVLGDASKAAVYYYPLDYVRVVFNSFFLSHFVDLPYWENIGYFGTYNPTSDPIGCDRWQTFVPCAPVIATQYSYSVWNAFIRLSNGFYRVIFPFLSIIFFLCLLYGIFVKDALLRLAVLLFFLIRIPVAMTTHPVSRYILHVYPLMIIIAGFVFWDMKERVRRFDPKRR